MTQTTTAQCTRCGRTLTSAKSIAAGVGPVCARRIRAAAVVVIATTPAAQVDKAIELIGDAGIVRVAAGQFLAVASDGIVRYETTTHQCSCRAGQFGRTCYHRIAAQLIAA